jgi:hypothetical protein
MRALLLVVVLALSCLGMAREQRKDPMALVKDYATMLEKRYGNSKELHEAADRLAEKYSWALKSISYEVQDMVSMVKAKAEEMGLQEKLGLMAELWRVRSSLDLLSLTDPATMKQLTGLTIPDLSKLRVQVANLKGF